MAIGLINIPNQVSFVENTMAVKVSSDNYVLTAGTNEVIIIRQHLFRPNNGVVINFEFNGITIPLKFLNNPSILSNDMPAFQSSYTQQVWMNLLVNAFRGHPIISEHWIVDIANGGQSVKLTAKEKGNQSSIFVFNGVFITAGTAEVLQPNLKIICRVECKNEYIKQRLPINNNGEAVFYIQDILKSFLYNKYNSIELPPINNFTLIGYKNTETQTSYKAWIAEELNNEISRYISIDALCDAKRIVYTGGLSKFANNKPPFEVYPINSKLSLLTHQPKTRKVLSHKEPEWITFTTKNSTIGLARYKIELKHKSTNAITTIIKNGLIGGVSAYTKFTMPMSLQDIIDLSTININDYSEYKIGLYDSNLALLFENTYRLKPHCKNYRYFLIENSLGGIDTFRLEGVLQKQTKTKKTNAERVKDFQRPKHVGSQWTTNVNNTESIKLKCDFFQSKKWAEYFREIQYSPRMFEYVVDRPYYADHQIPFKAEYKAINTKDSTFSVGNSKDRAYRFAFNYNYSNIENSF